MVGTARGEPSRFLAGRGSLRHGRGLRTVLATLATSTEALSERSESRLGTCCRRRGVRAAPGGSFPRAVTPERRAAPLFSYLRDTEHRRQPVARQKPTFARPRSFASEQVRSARPLAEKHHWDRKVVDAGPGQEWFMRGPFGYARRGSSRPSVRIALLRLYAVRRRPSTFKDQPSAPIVCCIAPRGTLNNPL
jgi:hypothetical protein